MRKVLCCALLLAFTLSLLATPFALGDAPEKNVRVTILYKGAAKTAPGFSATAQSRTEDISAKIKKHGGTIKHQFESINAVSAEVAESALEELARDPNVLAVERSRPVHAFLQESVPLIGASDVWQRTISGLNITGEGTSVCVIDSGVDYNHTDLGGVWGTKVIAGYNAITGQDCSSNNTACFDDNGHGTHVAGIVAANGSIKGVAPGTKIVAVKALDSEGSGYSSDVAAGIDWCASNSTNLNISAISMSLGGGMYETYCDNQGADNALFASSINAAVGKNISVVVATGNNGTVNNNAIASPACIQNATRVGATTKTPETIASFTSRGVDFPDMLLAPGVYINSTRSGSLCPSGFTCSGKYMVGSGTSMATPHVSGALALLSQAYKAIYGGTQTPAYFRSVLNSTGKQINDTAGTQLNFSRINVLAAYNLLASNASNQVTLFAPVNGSHISQNFSDINASQRFLGTMWFSVDGAPNITACASCTSFTNSTGNLSDGLHNVTVYANNSGAVNFTTAYFTTDTIAPQINFTEPTENNGTSFARSWIAANVSVNETNFANLTFRLYNESGLVNSTAYALRNETYINWTNLADGRYYFNATVFDLAGNSNSTETRTQLLVQMPPSIENISVYPPVGYLNQNITINFSSSSILSVNGSVNISHAGSIESVNATKTGATEYSAAFTNTSELGTYNITIFASDTFNRTSSASRSFEINEPVRLNFTFATNATLTLKIKYGTSEILSSQANRTENISATLAAENYTVEIYDSARAFAVELFAVNFSLNSTINITREQLANITSPEPTKFNFTNSSFSFAPGLNFSSASVCFNYTEYTAQFANISRAAIFRCSGSCADGNWTSLTTTVNLTSKLACASVTSFSYFALGETLPYCGDGNIDAGESCSSCPTDAGACPPSAPIQPPGGGGIFVFTPAKNKTAVVQNTSNASIPAENKTISARNQTAVDQEILQKIERNKAIETAGLLDELHSLQSGAEKLSGRISAGKQELILQKISDAKEKVISGNFSEARKLMLEAEKIMNSQPDLNDYVSRFRHALAEIISRRTQAALHLFSRWMLGFLF